MANTVPLMGGANSYNFPAPTWQPSVANTANAHNISGDAVASTLGFINGFLDRAHERKSAEEQRKWNEEMMEKQNEWSLDMWNKTNEYNSPTAQVSRLREAGLNPLYYGLDGTSANALESAQVMGYDRSSMKGLANPFQQGFENMLAARSLQKDIELKNAQIDKTKADTASVGLDNEWKDKTMDARIESERLANSLTKENIETVRKQRHLVEENIKKVIAETDNEYAKKLLIESQTAVQKAQEKEIVEMLPYKKLLMEAQTTAQKASAAAAFAKAAIDRKLLDEGYYDEMIREMRGKAKTAEEQAAITEFNNSVMHGNIYAIEDGDRLKYGKIFVNNLFNIISIFGSAITGPIASVLK